MPTTSPTPRGSLTSPGVRVPTLPTSAPTGASLGYLAEVAWLRDQSRFLHQDTEALHHDGQEQDLRRRMAIKARRGVTDLLAELADERGLGWSTIAGVVGVSVSALRKWRRGSPATPDNRRALAQLAALLDLIEEYQVNDPACWMEMPLPLPAGYLARPIDLYRDGYYIAILDLASGRRDDPAQALDDVWPAWRGDRSDWEVVDAPDGHKVIQRRAK